jgi:hypothetical protein
MTTTFLPGEVLSASKLQSLGLTGTYTPVLTASTTNPTMGSGAVANGWYHLNGRCMDVWFNMTFGSGMNPGSGIYSVSYPPGYSKTTGFPDLDVGSVRLVDISGGTYNHASVIGSTGMFFEYANGTLVTNSSPWTWAQGDIMLGHATYLVN